jgi:60 kDa SS-A/Ro ribonucleoprotein
VLDQVRWYKVVRCTPLEQWLKENGFVVFTDSETYRGRPVAPAAVPETYRRSVNPHARVIVVAMTAVGYTIGNPTNEGVAGLDAALPELITGFVRG